MYLQTEVKSIVEKFQYPVSVNDFLCNNHSPNKIAFYFENKEGLKKSITYGDLKENTAKLASVLKNQGVQKGNKVAVLLPKGIELIYSALAIWQLGAVYVPLFTAFGTQAIHYRVEKSEAALIITDAANRPKIHTKGDFSVDANKVKIITVSEQEQIESDLNFWKLVTEAKPYLEYAKLEKEDNIIVLYTSGTTGLAKGVEVPLYALGAFESYMRFGLNVQEDDTYWNLADPGWAYGLYFGVIGPLLMGATFIVYSGPFEASQVFRILEEYNVTNFAAAPTAYKGMQAYPIALENLSLKTLSSAGEPLNLEVIKWAQVSLGLPIYDHYGQTEQGMVINNHHHTGIGIPYKLGAMGVSMPGFKMVVLNESGNKCAIGEEGDICVDIENSPLYWFKGYLNDPAKTAERFIYGPNYYLTVDKASVDQDGYFYFVGRNDDIISSAGYRIGPFEVENTLLMHKAVKDVAVVGVPDPQRGEIVKACIVLQSEYEPSDTLSDEIKQFVKQNLSAHQYPREIQFLEELPKTPSGKIQRFLLKSRA
ncbi:AMP-binding protein [Solibacillus silvestris]